MHGKIRWSIKSIYKTQNAVHDKSFGTADSDQDWAATCLFNNRVANVEKKNKCGIYYLNIER